MILQFKEFVQLNESKLIELKTTFDIIDVLKGDITGDWAKQKKELEDKGYTCSKTIYDDAYQINEQP